LAKTKGSLMDVRGDVRKILETK